MAKAKTYSEIQDEIVKLQAQADQLRENERAEVIGRIKEAIAVYGLTAKDLGLSVRSAGAPGGARKGKSRRRAAAGPEAAKYQDGNGNVWGGRGPRPRWLREALAAGKALSDFAV